MKKTKNICVVGSGYWGRNHVKALDELGCLGGVVETNKNILDDIKNIYNYILLFDDLDKALSSNFDGFIVATPAETHFEISKKIILNGLPVLIEKPITLNLEDAIEIKKLSIEHKVNVMVGHVLLFHPAFQKMKEIIDSNQLGKIQYIYSNRLNLGKIRTEENVFWSFAPHDIALFQYFINDFPEKISSNGSDFFNRGIHDSTITSFEYPNGIMVHNFVSWLHPFKEHRFIIIGEKGMLSYEDSSERKPLIFYDKTVKWKNEIPTPNLGHNHFIDYKNELPLTLELKYFIENLDSNMFEISNCDMGIEVIKILEIATKNLKGNL